MTAVVRYMGGGGFGLSMDAASLPPRREALARRSESAPGVYPGAAVEGFLRRTFHSLSFIPDISFDARRVCQKAERKAFNAALARYRCAGMVGQADLLKDAYDGLRVLRMVLGGNLQNSLFETVIPSRFLPELLTAAPVWFIEQKGERKEGSGASEGAVVKYFCDLCATNQFAYLFQIYNSRVRYFTDLSGRDIMPLPIVELIRQVRNLFDYLVIATPYHDIASKEWGEMRWVRNVDPLLFGFLKAAPELMFFLGRWSGRGLFPRSGGMIGDTIEHLDKGKDLLANIHDRIVVWYRTETPVGFATSGCGSALKAG